MGSGVSGKLLDIADKEIEERSSKIDPTLVLVAERDATARQARHGLVGEHGPNSRVPGIGTHKCSIDLISTEPAAIVV